MRAGRVAAGLLLAAALAVGGVACTGLAAPTTDGTSVSATTAAPTSTIIVAGGTTAVTTAGPPPTAAPPPMTPGPVGAITPAGPLTPVSLRHVVDGDTLAVRYKGADEEVRLIGMDAPETGEPFAAEATALLQKLVAKGAVSLEFDVELRDQYGRLLAYVWCGGLLTEASLLAAGVAVLYTVPPNVAHTEVLQAAEGRARAAHAGMWGATAKSPVEIARIHANAAGDDNTNLNDEWVEFRTTVAGTLKGYAVEDDSGHHYDFPDRVLPKGAVFKLHSGSGADSAVDLYWGAGRTAIWNNGGDTVRMLDPGGHVVASRAY